MWFDWIPWIGTVLIERRQSAYLTELMNLTASGGRKLNAEEQARREPIEAEFERWRAVGLRRRIIYAQTYRQYRRVGWNKDQALPLPDPTDDASRVARHWDRLSPVFLAGMAGLVFAGWLGMGSVGGYLGIRVSPPTIGAGTAAIAYQSGRDEERSVELADGSKVTLRPASRLLVSMTPALRRLELLEGGASFRVAHDRARPFVVWAGGGSTTATGTLFAVQFEADRTVRVNLLEGTVLVAPPPSKESKAAAAMKHLVAGEHAIYGIAPDATSRPRGPAETDQGQLTEATIHFNYEPLAAVVAKLNAHSDVRIELADPALGRLVVYGDCHLKDVAGYVRSLAASFDLNALEMPGRLLLQAKAAPEK